MWNIFLLEAKKEALDDGGWISIGPMAELFKKPLALFFLTDFSATDNTLNDDNKKWEKEKIQKESTKSTNDFEWISTCMIYGQVMPDAKMFTAPVTE